MQQTNDAENLFLDEIRAKKKETASLRDSQKHKRMGKGRIRFASDFMNRKEKMEYRRAGTVTTTNIFDEILTMDDFRNLETHEQKNRMQYWRANNTIKQIQTAMGIPNAMFYKIIDELGLPKDRKTAKPRKPREATLKTKPAKAQEQPKWRLEPKQVETPAPIEKTPEPVQEIIVDGMHLVFRGTYTPDELQRQLLKYAGLLDDEKDNFYIELKLVQKTAK